MLSLSLSSSWSARYLQGIQRSISILGLFNSTRALEHLNLDRNPLLPLAIDTFAGLEHSLRNISCQSCPLTSISLPAFSRLNNLERLKLQSNLLTEIKPDSTFSSMSHLIAIDLQRNQLKEIPLELPASLRELELGYNQLTRFALSNETLQQLSQLDLSSNPLHCDCSIQPLHQWLLNHFQAELVPYVQWSCASPLELAGKQLGSLRESQFICHELPASTTTTTTTTTTSTTSILTTQ